MASPSTLMEAVVYFSKPGAAYEYLLALRWPNGAVSCPRCGESDPAKVRNRSLWRCAQCRKQFSLLTGTAFEASPLPLNKWLTALWLLSNAKNGVSSRELGRSVGVTQKTAWFMLHRLRSRMAVSPDSSSLLQGDVEADETFIGGKSRNMHLERRAKAISGRGPGNKIILFGMLERGGQVRAKVITQRRKSPLQEAIRANVKAGSRLYTDELLSYDGLDGEYDHHMINHAVCYGAGSVHTNGIENFWSLLKRSLNGTYVKATKRHLQRYADEQAFRFNTRRETDLNRFNQACRNTLGGGITWANLTS